MLKKFLLTDAIDRSKISSDKKRLFSPFHFSRTLPLARVNSNAIKLVIHIFRPIQKIIRKKMKSKNENAPKVKKLKFIFGFKRPERLLPKSIQ